MYIGESREVYDSCADGSQAGGGSIARDATTAGEEQQVERAGTYEYDGRRARKIKRG